MQDNQVPESGPRRSRTNSIGVVSTDVPGGLFTDNPYTNRLLQGILNAGDEHGYNVTVFAHTWRNWQSFDNIPPVDGLLILAPSVDTGHVSEITEGDIPIVATSAYAATLGVPTVRTDDDYGVTLAVQHLIDLGHTRIAHLAGTLTQVDGMVRHTAFHRVMSLHHLAVEEEYVLETGFDAVNAHADATRLLKLPTPPTAIFAATDYIAYWSIQAARDLGIDVPGQLSVVGYDDSPVALDSRPQITTIRQPLEEIGSVAANLLLEIISGRAVEPNTHSLPPELVVRHSTDRAPR